MVLFEKRVSQEGKPFKRLVFPLASPFPGFLRLNRRKAHFYLLWLMFLFFRFSRSPRIRSPRTRRAPVGSCLFARWPKAGAHGVVARLIFLFPQILFQKFDLIEKYRKRREGQSRAMLPVHHSRTLHADFSFHIPPSFPKRGDRGEFKELVLLQSIMQTLSLYVWQ